MNIFKLTLLFIASTLCANAQINYYQPFSIGAGYGVTIANAGEETITSSNATSITFNYHFSPYFSVSLEGQFGQLTGGDATRDTYGKQFASNFTSITAHTDLQLGEVIDYSHSAFLNGIKNFYVGTGLGILTSKIIAITLYNPADPTVPLTYIDNGVNVVVPLRVGYEFKIRNHYSEPQFRFDLNYSLNTTFGTGLDGYINPYSHAVPIKYYNYFSASVKYTFGPLRSYRKQIFYNEF